MAAKADGGTEAKGKEDGTTGAGTMQSEETTLADTEHKHHIRAPGSKGTR